MKTKPAKKHTKPSKLDLISKPFKFNNTKFKTLSSKEIVATRCAAYQYIF